MTVRRDRHLLSCAALPGAAAVPEPPTITATTDLRGRFRLLGGVAARRHVLVVDHPAATTVSRRLALDPSGAQRAFDLRLTPLAGTAGKLTGGAPGELSSPTQPFVRLSVEPLAITVDEDLAVHLTQLSGQGLPELLPLGWTPPAAVELRLKGAVHA